MSHNNETLQVINQGFDALVAKFPADSENTIMTDIIIQANADTGLFAIYDDEDQEIFSSIVEEWADNGAEDFYHNVENTLRKAIGDNQERLENMGIIKPYSFILADDEKETVSELHLVDDQLIVVDSTTLMENLDKDLNDFLERLMKE